MLAYGLALLTTDMLRNLLERSYDLKISYIRINSEDALTLWTSFVYKHFDRLEPEDSFHDVETGVVIMLLDFAADPNTYAYLFTDFFLKAMEEANYGYIESICTPWMRFSNDDRGYMSMMSCT